MMRPTNPACRIMLSPRIGRLEGFTLVELVLVVILLGILSFAALPRLSNTSVFQASAFQSEVVAALRYAHKSAISHRRLVCATVTASSVTLTIASANGAANCNAALPGPDGNNAFASVTTDLINPVPAGTIFFQPSGVVTSDGAGTQVANYTINVSGVESINVVGATGYVY